MGFRSKLLYAARSITVEPIALFYSTAMNFSFLVQNLVLYNAICIQQFSNDISVDCANLRASPEAENVVQSVAANWITITTLSVSIPAAFTGLMLGAWADRAGRKTNIILACGGTAFVQFSGYLYLAWPHLTLWIAALAAFIWGLTGYVPSLFMSSGAYIADSTIDPKMITIKFTNFFALVSLGGIISNLVTYVSALSLAMLNIIGSVFLTVAFFYTFFRLQQTPPALLKRKCYARDGKTPPPETYREQRKPNSVFVEVFLLLKDCFVCMFKKRPGNNRAFFITCVLVNCVYFIADIPVAGLISLLVLRRPFEWRQQTIGLYFLLWNIAQGTGKVIAAMFLKKVLNLRDTTLVLLSFSSILGYMVMVAFSRTSLVMFLTCLVGMFMSLSLPVIKSFSSKFVAPNEVGTLFGLFGVGQNIAFIASAGFNLLYSKTASWFPGLTFLVVAGMVVVILIAFIVVHFADMKQEKRIKAQKTHLVNAS